jgi:biopolymer transport protein ExbD
MISRGRLEFPEAGLSRAARACLVLDFLLLVFLGFWMSWNPDAYEQGPRVELAAARMLEEDCSPEDDRLILTVTGDGRVWRARERLDRLGEALGRAVVAYDEKRRAEGKSGFDDFPGGGRASRLRVVLRIDRATPWGAVQETLRRVGQSSLYKVYLLVANNRRGQTRLPSFLPTADRDYDYITARIGRDGEISLDGRDAPDLTEAIKTAYRADHAAAGLVDADATVPFEAVVRVLDAFACAGIAKVDLAADSVRAVFVPRR